MSRFYGSMKGSRGETTRCGDRGHGITAHVRGWDLGCVATMRVDANGEDIVDVYLTGGSNGSCARVFLGTFRRNDFGIERVYQGEEVPYVYKPGE